jgi:hypothetical protein
MLGVQAKWVALSVKRKNEAQALLMKEKEVVEEARKEVMKELRMYDPEWLAGFGPHSETSFKRTAADDEGLGLSI